MNKVTLYNVIDIRTGQYHSVVVTKEKYARFFVPADPEKNTEEPEEAAVEEPAAEEPEAE